MKLRDADAAEKAMRFHLRRALLSIHEEVEQLKLEGTETPRKAG